MEDSTFRAYRRNPGVLKSILPLSHELDAILRRVFEVDPSKRITLPELRDLIIRCPRLTTWPPPVEQVVEPLDYIPSEFIPDIFADTLQQHAQDYPPPSYFIPKVEPSLISPQRSSSSRSSGSDTGSTFSSSSSVSSSSSTSSFTHVESEPKESSPQPQYVTPSFVPWYNPLLAHLVKHMSIHPPSFGPVRVY